ncbi:MAG: hypothetical protein XD77_1468, partial [Marinimicrobia bacterium 46_47]
KRSLKNRVYVKEENMSFSSTDDLLRQENNNTNNNITESLILAQDKRWRRA